MFVPKKEHIKVLFSLSHAVGSANHNSFMDVDNIPNDSVKTLLSDLSDISDADIFVQPFAIEQSSNLKNKRKLASSDSYIPPPKKQRFLKQCVQRKISVDQEKKETSKHITIQKPAIISDIDSNIEFHPCSPSLSIDSAIDVSSDNFFLETPSESNFEQFTGVYEPTIEHSDVDSAVDVSERMSVRRMCIPENKHVNTNKNSAINELCSRTQCHTESFMLVNNQDEDEKCNIDVDASDCTAKGTETYAYGRTRYSPENDIDTNSSDINCNFSDIKAKYNIGITCLDDIPIMHTKKKELVCPERIRSPENILMTNDQQDSITICEVAVGRSSNIDEDPVMSPGVSCSSEIIITNNQQESEPMCDSKTDVSDGIENEQIMSPTTTYSPANITLMNWQNDNVDKEPFKSTVRPCNTENVILQSDQPESKTCDIDNSSRDINCNFSDINAKSNLDVTCLEETPMFHTKKKELVSQERIRSAENVLMTNDEQESITICEIGS